MRWMLLAVYAGLGFSLGSCGERRVDLRTQPEPVRSCPAGQRVNPETGRCAPCFQQLVSPRAACLCDYVYESGPFPLCAGERVDYRCLPCTGNVSSCSAYDAASSTVSSCAKLRACCQELAADPASTPCCPREWKLVCAPLGHKGEYTFECEPCCMGPSCESESDCENWQRCEDSRCTPACNAPEEYCADDCTCQAASLPN